MTELFNIIKVGEETDSKSVDWNFQFGRKIVDSLVSMFLYEWKVRNVH